jgi:prepilin-type processing-associated H-X9-DG protein
MVTLHIARWWIGASLIGLLAGFAFGLGAAEPEDELKSATVLSFVRHSEWLQGAATGPITIGVMGRPSMIRTLRRTLDGKLANNRAIVIVDAKAAAELNSCQVLYVATDNNNEVRQTLAGLRASHVLTIGEADRFLEYGGAVNLLFVDGHMSFEVSLQALDRAGVTVSSTLLRYGQVKARPPA